MRCVLAFTLALSLPAQDPKFEAQSRLVLVPVAVTNAAGRSVETLEPLDFRVLDNGKPQKVAVDSFGTGVAPIALVIAVQSSGISAPALEKIRRIGAMIQPLITGERGCAGLLTFSERVDWLQECTKDADRLTSAFGKLRPAGEKKARMLDAVAEAVRHLRSRQNARRVLLLISETRDRGSETELEPAIMAAQAAGVAVYAATYSAFKIAFSTKSSAVAPPRTPKVPASAPEIEGTASGAPSGRMASAIRIPTADERVDIKSGIEELKRLRMVKATHVLSQETGGITFAFNNQKGLEDTIEKLGGELHSQYLISFTPDSGTPGYHRIEVQINGNRNLHIRARPGYWATQ